MGRPREGPDLCSPLLSPASEGPNDETHWPEEYPTCGGDRQSPIDVQRKKVRYNPSLKALNLTGYEVQGGDFVMINNGHTGERRARLLTRVVAGHLEQRSQPFERLGPSVVRTTWRPLL